MYTFTKEIIMFLLYAITVYVQKSAYASDERDETLKLLLL